MAPTPFYNTTNDVQSKFSWGTHGYQPGPTFNAAAYNQAAAMTSPWGAQQSLTTTNPTAIASRVQAYNPTSMAQPAEFVAQQLPVTQTPAATTPVVPTVIPPVTQTVFESPGSGTDSYSSPAAAQSFSYASMPEPQAMAAAPVYQAPAPVDQPAPIQTYEPPAQPILQPQTQPVDPVQPLAQTYAPPEQPAAPVVNQPVVPTSIAQPVGYQLPSAVNWLPDATSYNMPNGQSWHYSPKYGTFSDTGEMVSPNPLFNTSIVGGYGGTLIA
jgi:hypothetical protein